jgi:hypothetical protein
MPGLGNDQLTGESLAGLELIAGRSGQCRRPALQRGEHPPHFIVVLRKHLENVGHPAPPALIGPGSELVDSAPAWKPSATRASTLQTERVRLTRSARSTAGRMPDPAAGSAAAVSGIRAPGMPAAAQRDTVSR